MCACMHAVMAYTYACVYKKILKCDENIIVACGVYTPLQSGLWYNLGMGDIITKILTPIVYLIPT